MTSVHRVICCVANSVEILLIAHGENQGNTVLHTLCNGKISALKKCKWVKEKEFGKKKRTKYILYVMNPVN